MPSVDLQSIVTLFYTYAYKPGAYKHAIRDFGAHRRLHDYRPMPKATSLTMSIVPTALKGFSPPPLFPAPALKRFSGLPSIRSHLMVSPLVGWTPLCIRLGVGVRTFAEG